MLRWWRRRESNPHPKVATSEIYTFSPIAAVSSLAGKQPSETPPKTSLTNV